MRFSISQSTTGPVITLDGSINEECETELLPLCEGIPPGHAVFDCHGIAYINSIGVMRWIGFLSEFSKTKHTFEFHRCSPVFVDYCLMLANFCGGGLIRSISVLFECPDCTTVIADQVYELASLPVGEQPGPSCPKCGIPSEAEFSFDEFESLKSRVAG